MPASFTFTTAALTSNGESATSTVLNNLIQEALVSSTLANSFIAFDGSGLQTDGIVGTNLAMVSGTLSVTSTPSVSSLTLTDGQITFPAAQVTSSMANVLDDYNKGTWTPTLSGFTIVNGTGSVTSSGTYIKVGHNVLLNCVISGTGTATIANPGGSIGGSPYVAAAVAAGSYALGNTGGGQVYFNGTTMFPTAWSAYAVSGNSIALTVSFIQ